LGTKTFWCSNGNIMEKRGLILPEAKLELYRRMFLDRTVTPPPILYEHFDDNQENDDDE
jgi:hypothetical protein